MKIILDHIIPYYTHAFPCPLHHIASLCHVPRCKGSVASLYTPLAAPLPATTPSITKCCGCVCGAIHGAGAPSMGLVQSAWPKWLGMVPCCMDAPWKKRKEMQRSESKKWKSLSGHFWMWFGGFHGSCCWKRAMEHATTAVHLLEYGWKKYALVGP